MVKRPSFSTFILKSSLVYVEGGLHAEFEVWEYSDTQSVPDLIINRLLKEKNGKSAFDEGTDDAV